MPDFERNASRPKKSFETKRWYKNGSREERKPRSENLIRIDGENISISLLVENPGLITARKKGIGRWCVKSFCTNHSTCSSLHRKEFTTKGFEETNISAVEMVLEQLAASEDPLMVVLSDETKKQGFKNMLQVTDLVESFVPILQRIIPSIDDSATPLPDELVEVRMWCDAWIIRSTEQMDKLRACSPALQKTFFSFVCKVCERDPASPDTRRGLAEASKLPFVSHDERQKATEFLQETESNIRETECNEENDQKHKRYVVNQMYHSNVIPVFDTPVWPKSVSELHSGFSELRELLGMVVDRFIPSEVCGLHLRVLQHLSRADFMHSLSSVARIIQERGIGFLQKKQKQWGVEQNFHIYQLSLTQVTASPFGGFLADFYVNTRIASQKDQFLTGDLLLLWQEGVRLKDESCFLAVVENVKGASISLSPVDISYSWSLLKPQARFLLIRSRYFYLPTAASLSQLRIQESKMAGGNAPQLLRALITGAGATAPPIYLLHNPPIEVGRCVALRGGSESEQPALGDWPCEEWSEGAEEKIRKSSDDEKALLDRTQMDALQHIMRNRVAIVQGTPGTGKSFIGSKFLQMLLLNNKNLKIGPIVVMTLTHHALESFFESVFPVAKRYKVSVGLLGTPQNEELKPYAIRTRRSRSETAKALIEVSKRIRAINSCSTVSKAIERIIMDAMQKHVSSNVYSEWCRGRRKHEEKYVREQKEYEALRKEVSGRLCIRLPEKLQALEQMHLALKKKRWHGEVDIIPFLKEHYSDHVKLNFDALRSSLNNIAILRRAKPINNTLINDAVADVEKHFSHMHNAQHNNILANSLDTFLGDIQKLITFLKSMFASYKTYTELWRLEGMHTNHKLPPLADMRAAEREREENTKEVEVIDVDLQQLEREEIERRRQERDLENGITGLEDKHHVPCISVPPKEERKALVRDACSRFATAPPGEERSRLISVLLQEEMYSLQEQLNKLVTRISEEKESLKEQEASMNALEFAKYAVIGATSTKMMLSIEAIQRCGASVLVVEEAAEVLESHLLACITESMQHVVLIGDHKQLKPKVNEYVLERRHNFAVSTMERMVLCGLPCVTLTMQRRMTPEISNLIKPYYRRSNVAGDVSVIIEDHPRTQNIPPPAGICRENSTPIRLFFFSHDGLREKAESMSNSMMSPENIFEAKIAARIAQYLMNYNYEKSITILTPYTGQQFALLKELKALGVQMRAKFVGPVAEDVFNDGVCLSTVDNYQGEEDDIIILSLVRTEKFGFLRLDNRACVALSRARSALYVIGCGALLSGASELWRHLEQTAKEQNCIGSRFPARCNRHPARDLSFGSAAEYDAHGARCTKQCGETLACGHRCSGECGVCSIRNFHSDCKVPGKALVCGHKSKKGCAATVKVCDKICSFCCGHKTPCDELSEEDQHMCSECPSRMCSEPCLWKCPHGKCSKECHLPCEFEPTVNNSADFSSTGCWRRCEKKLSCGHQCCGLCGERCLNFCRECYKAGDENTLRAAENVTTYIDDEGLEILLTDNSAGAQPLIGLPCCGTIFAAQELYSLFAVKMKENKVAALKCPQCRAIVLPNSFHHADTFIKKRFLQAAKIMKRVADTGKKQREHGLKEVINYIWKAAGFVDSSELIKLFEQVQYRATLQGAESETNNNLKDALDSFYNSCVALGLQERWILLLCYYLEVLKNAHINMRQNDSQIARNVNLLSKAALQYTVMSGVLSEKEVKESLQKTYCTGVLRDLVPSRSKFSKYFPPPQENDDVQRFCQRMEWTLLLSQIKSCSEISVQSFKNILRIAKRFTKRGVLRDEVDLEGNIKGRVIEALKQNTTCARALYSVKDFGLSADHWFECPKGHLCPAQKSVCRQCLWECDSSSDNLSD